MIWSSSDVIEDGSVYMIKQSLGFANISLTWICIVVQDQIRDQLFSNDLN